MSRELAIRNIKRKDVTEVLKVFKSYGEIEAINLRQNDEVLVIFTKYDSIRRVLDNKNAIETNHSLSTGLF